MSHTPHSEATTTLVYHPHEHHILPTSTYVKTLLALAALMLLTVWVAKFNLPGLGPISGTIVNQTIALIIACIKAYLVVMIFMGVKYSTNLTKVYAALGFVWFFLIFLILADYVGRPFESVQPFEAYGDSALPRSPTEGTKQPSSPNFYNVRPRQ